MRFLTPRRVFVRAFFLTLLVESLIGCGQVSEAEQASYDIPDPTLVVMHVGHVRALMEAQERAQASFLEEFFCLMGETDRAGLYHVTGVIKPSQHATVYMKGDTLVAQNVHNICPLGAIGDAHTHPLVDPNAHVPTQMDIRSLRRAPYPLGMIIYRAPDGPRVALWVLRGDSLGLLSSQRFLVAP